LSIRRQCRLLSVPRSRVYYQPIPMKRRHEQHHSTVQRVFYDYPFYGYRKMALELRRHEIQLSEKQTRNVMKALQIRAVKAKRNTSVKHPLNPIYPYLLRNFEVRYPNQVWCTDLTYIKLPGIGYVYLAAIMDIYSRKVLSWRVSNTMDSRFCEEALKEALMTHGIPAIFNTDQGSQFTSNTFTR